ALADTIAQRWLAMVASHYDATGQLLEKYDIEQCRAGGGGEYGTEIGFGWTNGVTLALMQDLG
ncbi:trehalase, partial [Sphingomonas koreensis]